LAPRNCLVTSAGERRMAACHPRTISFSVLDAFWGIDRVWWMKKEFQSRRAEQHQTVPLLTCLDPHVQKRLPCGVSGETIPLDADHRPLLSLGRSSDRSPVRLDHVDISAVERFAKFVPPLLLTNRSYDNLTPTAWPPSFPPLQMPDK